MIKLLLVDFDGVMSQDKFYTGYPESYEREFAYLQKAIFKENKDDLLKRWMRGKIDFRILHRHIAKEVDIDSAIYDDALIESVKRMKLNQRMLETVCKLRGADIKVALFTDNMDVFDTITVPYHRLTEQFDAIYSSSQHGKLKVEDDSLLRKICGELSVKPEEVALVDDSERPIRVVEGFGGYTFLYKEYIESHLEFEQWLGSRMGLNLAEH